MKVSKIWDDIKSNEVFFIAEIGKGFIQTKEPKSNQEYLKRAKELVREAKEAGASAVKFQTHWYEDEQMPIRVIAPHFTGEDRFTWVKRNSEITKGSFWPDLKKYCDELEILFFSTPMSRGAAMILNDLGVKLWKIGSGDILDFVMLDYIRNTDQPIIISSGMSSMHELELAISFLTEKNDRVALMHCVSKYPCPLDELNVGTVKMFRDKFDMPIGFSDHSLGFEGVLQAVKCGATIIEKHFSISRELWGSDHKVSMTPPEFAAMVQTVNNDMDKVVINKKIIGNVKKELKDRHSEFRSLFRKSLVAGRNIKKDEIISIDMLYAMRPQGLLGGIKSERAMEVVGNKAKQELKKYEVITEKIVGLDKKTGTTHMMNNISVLAIIPARGGSKGIRRKNIINLCGQPLIAHTLQALANTKHDIDHIVSTEDEEIKEIANMHGGNVPFLRPVELATDDANIVDVIKDILTKTSKIYEYILLLQPTAPLRTADDIDAVLELAALHNPGSVCSFTRMETYHPWYMYYLKNGKKIKQVIPTETGKLRQEFPEALWRNGAIYLVKTELFLKDNKFITDDCVPYIMPPERSVNIDSKNDLLLAKFYLQKLKKNKKQRVAI